MIARRGAAPQPAPGPVLSGGRNFTKARVFAVSWAGRAGVLKSVRHQPLWLRWLAGRRWIDREEQAYRRLSGVTGVPRFLARPDADSLVCERVEGSRLDHHRRRSLPPGLFDALERVLEEAHARGVAHGDLHRRDVIVGEDGLPWVLDWATSLTENGRGGAMRRALFQRWLEIDRRAARKLRARYATAGAPEAESLEPSWALHRWIWKLRRWKMNGHRSLWGRLRLLALFIAAGILVCLAHPTLPGMLAGLALLLPGEGIRLWASGHLLKSKELVTSGPYAYTQNPLYLGRLLILSGLAIMCWIPGGVNWMFLGAGLAGFFLYYMPRKLRVEGARLEGRHGEAWRRYRQAVPVLFPAVRPYDGAVRLPWSWERMVRNREHFMILGLGAVVALLWSRLPR